MRTMHLFAGIGGGLLADLILGHEPIVAVEWEPYACQVLRERASEGWFPGLHVWEGDVRMFNPSEYAGKVDCIHAGFPCQDISVAGKQAGVGTETRSGLYREVLRIAGVVRPQYLFLENVSAIVSNGLGTVLSDLAALGYDSEWLCLRASDCGANHHRDRWWLLANSNEFGAAARTQGKLRLSLQDGNRDDSTEERKRNELHAWSSGVCEVLADTSCTGRKKLNFAALSERARFNPWGDVARRGYWAIEPGLGRVVDGVPDRVGQLKGYGNAQVPLQAAVAWKLLGGE